MKGIIRLSSVTYAMRAQKILEQNGVRSHVKKVTLSMKEQGCGYGLEVTGNLDTAVSLIEGSGIRIVEVIPAA